MDFIGISTINFILTRMMNEALFADAVFDNAETALLEYNLLPEEIKRFKLISRQKLISMTLEDRKRFAEWVMRPEGKCNPLIQY